MRVIKGAKGFSLVELMVVVSIIGILAAIAVPNFQRFTAKAKQSEAKSDLAAVYSANVAFKAEWQTYTSSFQAMGYAPTGTFRYNHGFPGDFFSWPPGYTQPGVNSSSANAICGMGTVQNGCQMNNVPLAPPAITGGVTPTAVAFTIDAIGDIDGDPTMDEWTMDQNKTIANPRDDVNN